MKCNRKIRRAKFVRIKKVSFLPKRILSSHLAAYHPFSRTIWLTKWRYLPHELGHFLIHLFGGKHKHQNYYDFICIHLFGRKREYQNYYDRSCKAISHDKK